MALSGRLLVCANEIDPQLNVPVLTDDVGAILQHLFLRREVFICRWFRMFNRTLLVSACQIVVIASHHQFASCEAAPSPRCLCRKTTEGCRKPAPSLHAEPASQVPTGLSDPRLVDAAQ